MRPFRYLKPTTVEQAIARGAAGDARYLAGGTTLVDLMRIDVVRPAELVDVSGLPLDAIEITADGATIGARATNTAVARHPQILSRFPVLSEALLSGASPQIRNAATVGGNLLQRTRCPYFRDLATACNKRDPGTGCSAIGGYTRSHAVLGTSSSCIATHPSDMCVALLALDATVHVRGPNGERAIPIEDFHVVPGTTPHVETRLARGELITKVTIPSRAFAVRSRYVKVRDRAAFAFALASAAVALEIERGKIVNARVALGGVATKPWRSHEAEAALIGKPVGLATYEKAAAAAIVDPHTETDNAFKVELAQRTLTRALALTGGIG